MAKTVGIGYQDFEKVREKDLFYVDKTGFIQEWWENEDEVTLIIRPRRFGKTLNMSMLEKFFSVQYTGREDLFREFVIWEDEKYRSLQGTYPVISLSFANVKETTYQTTVQRINRIITNLYNDHRFLLESELLSGEEKNYFLEITEGMPKVTATMAIHQLSKFLYAYYGKKVIILLDEYDTPMQEAYVYGYWKELVTFTRGLFNSTFKTNPYMERAVMTGITRVSRESIFSDLNNLEVVTTTSEKYADSFGFTEEEVFAALDEFGLAEKKQEVKAWYDGFAFGSRTDIYNPWSILNYLEKKKIGTYWANSSSNSLAGKLIREGTREVKQSFEALLYGEALRVEIDEQIVYGELQTRRNAVWSLLLASGYLKVLDTTFVERLGRTYYKLTLTNREVHIMFESMILDWFSGNDDYNDFIKALLLGDIKAMNTYMNRVTQEMFSYFDTGKSNRSEPERFYHGFVLGLMVELADRYVVTSNRESGFGRYDVMLEPRRIPMAASEGGDNAIILEFKVQDEEEERELTDTVTEALKQIEEKDYQASLIAKGIPGECIRKYGFAFCGKKVLIGAGER